MSPGPLAQRLLYGTSHPEWLAPLGATLLLLALAVGISHRVARRRRRALLGGAGRVVHRSLRSDAALLAAALALAIAALGPRIGERVERVPATGVDVVFALDVSRSMDARDVPPSRLDRAKRAVAELLARLEPQDRAGLAAFAGGAVVLAPLTPDREVLLELLSGVDTELIRPRGSDLGAGVRAALPAFESGSERPRVLVVLSDGEDPEHRRDLAAADVARAGVRVLPLAFGSEAGATLPDHGVSLVDGGGRTVVSRRDAARLETLARASDGALFVADDWGALDFDEVTRALRRDAGKAPGETVLRRVRAVRVLPFAALAFALLLLEGLPRPRGLRGAWPRSLRALRALAPGLATLLLALPSPAGDGSLGSLADLQAQVRERPRDPAALIALGAARLERGRRDEAARAFLAAALRARDPDAAAMAYFDLGVTELERKDLPAARRAFLDALAMDPGDERARFNLEWTLLALAQRTPPESPPASEPESQPPRRAPLPTPEPPSEKSPPPPAAPEAAPPPLSEPAQRRLLERIEDDPVHALRSAAGQTRSSAPRRAVVW